MNEEDKDIDVESDEVPEVGREATATTSNSLHDADGGDMLDKRAHHNALERRRRDHIKDSFHGLRDCIPAMEGEKVSRAHILNKATDYIRQMQKGGLLREVEISDLKEKNEVLEEQVQALEQARALGNAETSDEILQTITEQIQARQEQQRVLRLQQPPRAQGEQGGATKPSDKAAGKGGKDGSKPSGQAATSTAKFPSVPAAGQQTKAPKGPVESQQNQINFNLFASNLKSAQSLLTALQKTTGGNLPANVKSLAARVLASPLRTPTTATATPQAVPRGIVTATTVANQTTSLAGFLQKQLSTTPPSVAPKVVAQSQGKPVASTASVVSTSSASGANKSTVASVSVAVSSVTSTTTSVSTAQSQKIASSLLSQSISSQLLAANSLLKQSTAAVGSEGSAAAASDGGGTNTSALSSNQQLASELLAQVTSFLNLPTPAVAGTAATATGSDAQGGEGGEGVSLLSEALQNATPLEDTASTPTTTAPPVPGCVEEEGDGGRKRVAPHQPEDGGISPKKPRIEQ